MKKGRLQNPGKSEEAAGLTCCECGKRNPANRLRCLYCDAGLGSQTAWPMSEKLISQKPEAWENGFNLIYKPDTAGGSGTSEFLSNFLGLEGIENAGSPGGFIPIARLRTLAEAETLQTRLRKSGVEAMIAADEFFNERNPPIRLRAIEFGGGAAKFRSFNGDRVFDISGADVATVIIGSIYQITVESTVNLRRRSGQKTNETESFADEIIMDVYLRGDQTGFRIMMHGFDFSCLGDKKMRIAAANIVLLAGRLSEFAPNAAHVEDYDRCRKLLDEVWGLEETRDSQGLRRTGMGRVEISAASKRSNLVQFTKYSRLQAIFG